jgi:hypothetical protein
MLNFRFHIVSLVAVFLALAIGIIMGSTVIDRALVDTLEDQQETLRDDLGEIRDENSVLRAELDQLRDTSDRLATEGGERLLDGTLGGVPVLVVAVRGIEADVVEDLEDLLLVAGADDLGTLWLTGRLTLDEEEAVTNLREVLAMSDGTSADGLRSTVARRLADAVRTTLEGLDTAATPTTTGAGLPGPEVPAAPLALLAGLRDAGFVEYDAPEGAADEVTQVVVPGMRIIVVSGPGADVADAELAAPLTRALVDRSTAVAPPVPVLAAELSPEDGEGEAADLVRSLRSDDVQDRLSTVDNLDSFAGRLAAVVAVQDLGVGRRGHFGVGPGAQRLVPAPAG